MAVAPAPPPHLLPLPILHSVVCCADELDELSFTELLNMDLEADDANVATVPASSSEQQEAPPLPGVSSVTRPRSRRGGPGTAPKGSKPPQQSAAMSSQALLLLTLIHHPANQEVLSQDQTLDCRQSSSEENHEAATCHIVLLPLALGLQQMQVMSAAS